MEIPTAILPNTTTICDTVADTTATLQIIFNPSKNTSTVLKPPKNKSKVLGKPSNKSRLPTISLNKKPSPNKSSSFRSILLPVLLIFFILCLIGLVLFFLFHSQRNQQNDDESLLDRNISDESFNSVEDESEIDRSTEHEIPIYANLEPSEINKSRKGGRIFSQLDPEAF
jgi:cbb3-type cytochrome oxidase subunit 3